MNGQTGDHLEELRAECTALRERLRQAEDQLSPTNRSRQYLDATGRAPPRSDETATKAVDQAIGEAARAALRLMETALAERIRAASMELDLQREIKRRLRAEEALEEAEHRYHRILDTIGKVRWISTEDWETILEIDNGDRT